MGLLAAGGLALGNSVFDQPLQRAQAQLFNSGSGFKLCVNKQVVGGTKTAADFWIGVGKSSYVTQGTGNLTRCVTVYSNPTYFRAFV